MSIAPHINKEFERIAIMVNNGQYNEALPGALKLLPILPNRHQIYQILIAIYQRREEFDKAEDYAKQAIEKFPNNHEINYGYGLLLLQLKRYEESAEYFAKTCALDPKNTEALRKQGFCLYMADKHKESGHIYKKYLQLHPEDYKHYPDAMRPLLAIGEKKLAFDYADKHFKNSKDNDTHACYHNIGAYMMEYFLYDDGVEAFQRAIDLEPHNAEAYAGLGACLQQSGRFDEALNAYNKALEINPEQINANWNISQLLLLLGDFVRGWEQYEWRWKTEKYSGFTLPWTIKEWKGEALAEKPIIVHCEQGLGDIIFFMSFVERLAGIAKKVYITVDPRMETLMARSLPVEVCVGGYLNEPNIAIEKNIPYYIPLGSVAWRIGGFFFGPFKLMPWLQDDEIRTSAYKKHLHEKFPGKKFVGLSWFTRHNRPEYNPRNITLQQLMPLLQNDQWQFVNLQYGADTEPALQQLHNETGIEIYQMPGLDCMNDIDGLASLVKACDRVITIDNTTVHLAGGLGVATDLLLTFASEWRWGRGDNPKFYPNCTIYKQPKLHNWDEPIARLTNNYKNIYTGITERI